MNKLSDTKNQHYVSQAEQRLNAVDPQNRSRIHAFKVIDRECWAIRRTSPKAGQSIRKSLSCIDLFSFHVIDDRYRHNLESRFQSYEQDVARDSQNLLVKLQSGCRGDDIRDEVLNVFAAKLMNFARNPYCVRKILNTFGSVVDSKIADRTLQKEFDAVVRGSRPHRSSVCKQFALAEDEYDLWLKMLFMMLSESSDGSNVFNDIIKNLFETRFVLVNICSYTSQAPGHICLLSDRGINSYDMQAVSPGVPGYTFEFNIAARSFACFTFCEPESLVRQDRFSHESELKAALRARVNVVPIVNHLEALTSYNRRTVYQAAKTVFGASAEPIL